MKYMIHACPNRAWYVNGWLIPRMEKQGIRKEDIILFMDVEKKGNLQAWLDSCEYIKTTQRPGDATWHLQDDVAISDTFKERTEKGVFDIHGNPFDGVVCGFCNSEYDRLPRIGVVEVPNIWWSFQCIRIPNWMLTEFLEWFYDDSRQQQYRAEIAEGKHDDMFFKDYLCTFYYDKTVYNLAPNLVEHVDFMLGGSVINRQRIKTETRASFWGEDDVIADLKAWIKEEKNEHCGTHGKID